MTGPKEGHEGTEVFEHVSAKQSPAKFVLKLYVAGTTPASMCAVANVKHLCEKHLKGHYELEVIDLYQQPTLAKGEKIIAAPTLIKKLPLPVRRISGDMSDLERVLVGIGLKGRQ